MEMKDGRTGEFLKMLNERGCKVGAEIGVMRGWYSDWMFYRIKGLKLYCIDPWKEYEDYVEGYSQRKMDDMFRRAQEKLKNKNVEFIRKMSSEAVNDFEDESLDFVFIDGNHTFEYVIEDIAKWEKKVKKGGIVSGHDYWNSIDGNFWAGVETEQDKLKLCQVKDAVDAWAKTNKIDFTVVKGDKCPSWFYVKE